MKQEEKSFLIGCALGDGYLVQKKPYGNVSLVMQHSTKQEEYLKWKVDRIGSFMDGPQPKLQYLVSNGYPAVRWTKAHPYFTHIKTWLYPKGKKRISAVVTNKITAEAFAVWWCDDGSMYVRRNAATGKVNKLQGSLSTYVSEEDNKTLIRYFEDAFGVHFRLGRDKKGFVLRLNSEGCREISNVLLPHVPPCMQHKILV